MQIKPVAGLFQDLPLDMHETLAQFVQRSIENNRIDPNQWTLTCDAEEPVWLHFHKREAAPLPDQGWKLHVTADPDSAESILQRVLPLLLQRTVSFKFASSLIYLRKLNSGLLGESQIGKFITIYPANDEEAVALAIELDQSTRGLSGPQIPSDRPLNPNSLVFYRYGGFSGKHHVQELIGLVWPAIKTPDDRLIPDKRGKTYIAPEEREDPFIAAGIAIDSPGSPRLLAQRYLIVGIIAKTLRHTIALTLDTESLRTCIIKSQGSLWQNALPEYERQTALREAEVLRKLDGYEYVPALYDVLEQESDILLVMSDIPGQSLDERRRKWLTEGLPNFQQIITWSRNLAEILAVIHDKGLVFADIKPTNILIGPDEKLSMIDFELATPIGTLQDKGLGTRGYMSPQQIAGEPRAITDDIYAFGAVLYSLVTGAEASQAPDASALLKRPIERLRPDVPPALAALITRCLQEQPEDRYASFHEMLPLFDNPQISQPSPPPASSSDMGTQNPGEEAHALSIAQDLLHTLCQKAYQIPNGTARTWKTLHPGAHKFLMRDTNFGHAGTALALAGLIAELPDPEASKILLQSTRWLQETPPYSNPPLPGLYVGEAGVGASLLAAGQVLDDSSLIAAAAKCGRLVATIPQISPDIMHGTAGRLLFHLLLWDETGEQEHLDAAMACGEFLLEIAQVRENGEVCWVLPGKEYKGFASEAYLGYAHGVAGIADSLLDLFEATGDERFKSLILGASQWLQRQAISTLANQSGFSWPSNEHQSTPSLPWWCHGSTGIGRFFLRASRHNWLPGTLDTAERAAQTVIHLGKSGGSTLCHGLAGNIEFLLDMYQETRKRLYLAEARALGHILEAFAITREGLLMFQSDHAGVYSPDYQVGYAGIAITFLRLSAPERIPYHMSRSGFQSYKKTRRWRK